MAERGSDVTIDVPLPRRWPRALPDMPIVILGALAAAALAYLARSMTFWQDEWGFISFAGGPLDLFRPQNEHWQTIPLLLYRATFTVFGLHSYLPYVAEVIGLHLVAVGAAYVLIRRRTGRLAATLACVPLLLLGSGSENLFWAFQTVFIGSVAFGLWALVLLETRGRAATAGAAVLLVASLMSSGIGLAFLAAAFGRTILDREIRPRAWVVVPPTVVFLAWYLVLGHTAESAGLAGVSALPGFVARGIGHAVGAFTGIAVAPRGELLALGVFAAAFLVTAWGVLTMRPPPALAAGALLAIGAMYFTIGLVRAQLPSDFATRSRYVYVAAFLLVIAVADWLPSLRDRARGRLPRAALSVGLSVVLVATMVANVAALQTIRARFQANADLTRAYIALAVAHQNEPWVDPASLLLGMPSLPDLVALVRRSGSPTRDDLIPAVARDPGVPAREAALLRMVGPGFRAEPGSRDAPPPSLPLTIASSKGLAIVGDGPCLSLRESGGAVEVTAKVPTGSRLRLTVSNDTVGRAFLGLALPPSRSIDLVLAAATPLDVVVPDTGDASIWTVRVVVPAETGSIQFCRVEGS
jgi:hypothetical protein